MIVYSGNKASFQKDAINGVLARRIDEIFRSFGIPKESYAEYKPWENSLPQMGLVLSDPRIDNEVQVALPVEKTIFSLEERKERLLKILKLSGLSGKAVDELEVAIEKDYVNKFWIGCK